MRIVTRAAGLGIALALHVVSVRVEPALATPPASVKSLLPGRLEEVTYPPAGSSARHRHSCGVVVYVLRGALKERLGSGAPFVVHQGEAFYESPHQEHVVSANASSTRPASFLAAFTCDPHPSHAKGTH